MNWYVIHTKSKQEQRALENLKRQGYECYLPTLEMERVLNGRLAFVSEAMFPRYLFICLDDSKGGKSWSAIRSTKGVSRLVTFGAKPAKVDFDIIENLRAVSATSTLRKSLFTCGERVLLTDGPFEGIEGIFNTLTQIKDGESRALILIELLHKPVTLSTRLTQIKKLE
ncbi:transcription/translation regulatory transformer protein RfaH [Oxalobacteraceae bacterium CAVE-383]|nr:transcription/translation regulatory transformer protein RfaH [Oxalobacteraceae bacterium CAVE-383]